MEKPIRMEDVLSGLNRQIQECLKALDLCVTDDQYRAIQKRREFLLKCKEQCLLAKRRGG